MWQELGAIFAALSSHPDVRAIVLSGAGDRAFTAGLDLAHAAQSPALTSAGPESDGARKAQANRLHILDFQRCITAVEACAKPVACVLHGVAYGLGVDLSCAADVRFASADARLCVKEVDIGLAADIGTLTRLPKIVGSHSWVKDVCLSARIWGAEEALRVGYVSDVAPDKAAALGRALAWAAHVAHKSPVAVQGTKELLNYSREHTTAEGLAYTAVWNAAALQTSDTARAMAAGREKRVARFEKL